MEAKFLAQGTSLWLPRVHRRHKHKPGGMAPILAVLTGPVRNTTGLTVTDNNTLVRVPADTTQVKPSVFHDNWFDKMAIYHLSQNVQAASGFINKKSGFESLLEVSRQVSRNFNPIQQREIVIRALENAFPRPILSLIRALLPQSKFAREYFAVFTTLFFAWLVGPCEVKESEFNGAREKNVVHIKTCRFLEQSNCVGMCVNMCKMPCQTFIKDTLGMSVNMVPNFDDMSCEMIFGQDPPAPNNDPALTQPCYKLCKAKQKHTVNCSS